MNGSGYFYSRDCSFSDYGLKYLSRYVHRSSCSPIHCHKFIIWAYDQVNIKHPYDKIGQANVRTQTEFSPESLLRNWFILVKYDTYDAVWGGGALCVREREKKTSIHCMCACLCASFRPHVRPCVCVFLFFTVFVTSQCDVGIYQHDSLVFCFRDHGTISAK
jgi:hypothetical protein